MANFSRLWSGLWHTTTDAERGPLGDITFTQTGDQVTGTYSQGTLHGTAKKGDLFGSIQDNIAGEGSFEIQIDELIYSSFVGSLKFNNDHTFTGNLDVASYSEGEANLTTVMTVKKFVDVRVGDFIQTELAKKGSKNLGPEPAPAGGYALLIAANAILTPINLSPKEAAHDCTVITTTETSGIMCQMNSLGPASKSNKFGGKFLVQINSVRTDTLNLRASFVDLDGFDRAYVRTAFTGHRRGSPGRVIAPGAFLLTPRAALKKTDKLHSTGWSRTIAPRC